MPDTLNDSALKAHLAAVFALAPAATAVESKESAVTWGQLAAAGEEIERLLVQAGGGASAPLGWGARNRPPSLAGFAALGRPGPMVGPRRPHPASARFCHA